MSAEQCGTLELRPEQSKAAAASRVRGGGRGSQELEHQGQVPEEGHR